MKYVVKDLYIVKIAYVAEINRYGISGEPTISSLLKDDYTYVCLKNCENGMLTFTSITHKDKEIYGKISNISQEGVYVASQQFKLSDVYKLNKPLVSLKEVYELEKDLNYGMFLFNKKETKFFERLK